MDNGEYRPLPGGVANSGAVFRVGNEVRRPHRANSPALQQLMEHLAAQGLEAPQYLGLHDHGNDRLTFIPGDVPLPPFPEWALTSEALRSVAHLLRRTHEATRTVTGLHGAPWDRTFSAPLGGPVIGHNDVCPENTVFRGGRPVAFIDYEFAAPTEPLVDLAHLTRMWAPLGLPDSSPRRADDLAMRIAQAMDGYGTTDVAGLAGAVNLSVSQARTFVRRQNGPRNALLTDAYFERRRIELVEAILRPRPAR